MGEILANLDIFYVCDKLCFIYDELDLLSDIPR